MAQGMEPDEAALVMVQLMLGDCLERMKELRDGSVDAIICDLPYGTTACSWDSVIPLVPMWAEFRRITKSGSAIVLTASQPFTTALVGSNLKEFRYELIWEKSKATGHALCNVRPMKAHENVCVFSRAASTYNPQKTPGKPYKQRLGVSESIEFSTGSARNDNTTGDRYPRSVVYFKTAESEGKSAHPTQKPLGLLEYLVKTYTNEGATVLDATMGSGSTGVAALNTGRRFIGIERDPTYFAIAQKRIAEAQAPAEPSFLVAAE